MAFKTGIFSFFAGAGFLDLGFEKSGYETLFVNEYHKPFLDVYTHSRKALKIAPPTYGTSTEDITEFLSRNKTLELKERIEDARKSHDLIGFIGGPPCPDFSIGGKNRGQDGENGKLSGSYVELICRTKPDFFLFENVKGLYRTKVHREFFESLKSKLINAGYRLTEKLINALEYGAPQDRERIILIGFKKDILNDLALDTGSTKLTNFNWDSEIKYTMEQINNYSWPATNKFNIDSKRAVPSNIPEELTVEHWFNKNSVYTHVNSETYFQPRAGLAKFLVIDEGDDSKKSYKRLHRWRYSPTAAYGNNEVHLHPYKARRLSAAEALAIQSLPKEFTLPENITLSDSFKTIGNGVPYLAAKGLANTISKFLTQNYADINSQQFSEAYSELK